MKNNINIFLACLVIFAMSACDTAGGLDTFGSGDESALSVWVTAPKGDLILSDPTTGLAYEVEFIDATDGSSVEQFTIDVEVRDKDGNVTNSGNLLTTSTFAANANGNQGLSGTITVNGIAAALSTTAATFSEKDEFHFSTTHTVGGVVLANGNANQFLKSTSNFSETIAVETVEASVTIKNSKVDANGEYVIMAFKNDFGVALETMPTFEILNGGGGSFGPVEVVPFKDPEDTKNLGKDSVYQAKYTPAVDGEVITFRILSASAVTVAGFDIVADTVKKAFTTDLTAPTISGNQSVTSATGQFYNLFLSEDIGSVSLKEDFKDVDDDEDGMIDGADTDGDAVKVDITFSENFLDFKYDWEDKDGEVTLTLVIKDPAGNVLDLSGAGLDTITLVPAP
ncbi:MAG: hypothetical protein ABJG78_19240 [Cyclobacteriaceae bacterium]